MNSAYRVLLWRSVIAVCLLTFAGSIRAQGLQCLPASPVQCSTGWLGVILPPIAGYSEIFSAACMRHDYCYRFGASTYRHSRGQCDSEFLRLMRKKCNDTTLTDYLTLGLSKAACHGAASAYYNAVSSAGSSAFNSSGEFCEYDGPAKDLCRASTAENEACWTGKFSEENGGSMLCPQGKALAGIWCTGDYCDNKNLYCKPMKYRRDSRKTEWISEEQPDASFRIDKWSNPSVLIGLKCRGAYCDDLRGYVGKATELELTGDWDWLPWFSEEQGVRKCADNHFMTGLGCKGSYCDQLSLHCSAFGKH